MRKTLAKASSRLTNLYCRQIIGTLVKIFVLGRHLGFGNCV